MRFSARREQFLTPRGDKAFNDAKRAAIFAWRRQVAADDTIPSSRGADSDTTSVSSANSISHTDARVSATILPTPLAVEGISSQSDSDSDSGASDDDSVSSGSASSGSLASVGITIHLKVGPKREVAGSIVGRSASSEGSASRVSVGSLGSVGSFTSGVSGVAAPELALVSAAVGGRVSLAGGAVIPGQKLSARAVVSDYDVLPPGENIRIKDAAEALCALALVAVVLAATLAFLAAKFRQRRHTGRVPADDEASVVETVEKVPLAEDVGA